MKKIDGMKLLGVAGTVLGLAATFISSVVQQKTMDETIKKEVNEALSKMNEKKVL